MKNHYDNIYSNRIFKLRHPGDSLKDNITIATFINISHAYQRFKGECLSR